MRLGGLLEREGLVDLGLDAAGLDERPDALAQRVGDRALELARARAQRRAGDGEAPLHDLVDVELALRTAQEGDEDQPAFLGEALELLRDIVAADHVEDDVHALAAGLLLDFRFEIMSSIVASSGRDV